MDDTIDDSPEGMGLFRHLVKIADRLERYELLEGWGFETDLRGVPVARGPFTDLEVMVQNGTLSRSQASALKAPMLDMARPGPERPVEAQRFADVPERGAETGQSDAVAVKLAHVRLEPHQKEHRRHGCRGVDPGVFRDERDEDQHHQTDDLAQGADQRFEPLGLDREHAHLDRGRAENPQDVALLGESPDRAHPVEADEHALVENAVLGERLIAVATQGAEKDP